MSAKVVQGYLDKSRFAQGARTNNTNNNRISPSPCQLEPPPPPPPPVATWFLNAFPSKRYFHLSFKVRTPTGSPRFGCVVHLNSFPVVMLTIFLTYFQVGQSDNSVPTKPTNQPTNENLGRKHEAPPRPSPPFFASGRLRLPREVSCK